MCITFSIYGKEKCSIHYIQYKALYADGFAAGSSRSIRTKISCLNVSKKAIISIGIRRLLMLKKNWQERGNVLKSLTICLRKCMRTKSTKLYPSEILQCFRKNISMSRSSLKNIYSASEKAGKLRTGQAGRWALVKDDTKVYRPYGTYRTTSEWVDWKNSRSWGRQGWQRKPNARGWHLLQILGNDRLTVHCPIGWKIRYILKYVKPVKPFPTRNPWSWYQRPSAFQ